MVKEPTSDILFLMDYKKEEREKKGGADRKKEGEKKNASR